MAEMGCQAKNQQAETIARNKAIQIKEGTDETVEQVRVGTGQPVPAAQVQVDEFDDVTDRGHQQGQAKGNRDMAGKGVRYEECQHGARCGCG